MERSRILLKMGVEVRTRLLRLRMIHSPLLLEENGDLMMIYGEF